MATIPRHSVLPVDWLPVVPNGLHPRVVTPFPSGMHRPERRSWLAAQAVTAALLVLTLIGGLVAFGLRPGADNQQNGGGVIPAPVVTPENAAELLVEVALTADDTLPEPFALQIWFGSIAPEGRVAVTADFYRDTPATNVQYVLEGSLVVRVAGPLRVMRASMNGAKGTPEAISPGTEVVLGPGDAAVFPWATEFELVNPTQSVVRLLGAGVLSPIFTPVAPGYSTGRYAYSEHVALPPGPLRLSLLRVTLEPDALLPPPAAGELRTTLPESVDANSLDWEDDGSLRNPHPEAIVLYLLVLGPSGTEAATPEAGQG